MNPIYFDSNNWINSLQNAVDSRKISKKHQYISFDGSEYRCKQEKDNKLSIQNIANISKEKIEKLNDLYKDGKIKLSEYIDLSFKISNLTKELIEQRETKGALALNHAKNFFKYFKPILIGYIGNYIISKREKALHEETIELKRKIQLNAIPLIKNILPKSPIKTQETEKINATTAPEIPLELRALFEKTTDLKSDFNLKSGINSALRAFLDKARGDLLSIPLTTLVFSFNAALQVGDKITNPEDKTTLLTVAEKIAQKAPNIDRAMEIRMKAAQAIAPASPFADLHLKLSNADPKSGLRLQPLDTFLLKNHSLTVQKRRFTDGTTKLHIYTKLNHPAREKMQTIMNQLNQNPFVLSNALPKGFCKKVKITQAFSGYYKREGAKWEGDFSTDQSEGFGFKNYYLNRDTAISPTSHVIEFVGVGKVIIGNNPELHSEYNQLAIELDPNIPDEEAAAKLHIIFAALGLSAVTSNARSEDIERIKVMQLFRAYYPQEAYSFERDSQSFEESIESLKARIMAKVPQMKWEFERLANQPDLMYQQEVYPGQYVWSIKGLAQEARDVGAIALMAGVGTLGDTSDVVAQRIVSMLKTGSMSSQDRLQAGMIIKGCSPDSDLISGGAESVFTRMVTKDMSKKLGDYPLAGKMQILYDLDVVERVGFGYNSDQFGTKNPKTYPYRPNIVELTEGARNLNEVCIRNRIGPKFIKGVLVENDDEKKNLLDALRAEGLLEGEAGNEHINGISIEQFIQVEELKPEYLLPPSSSETTKVKRQVTLRHLDLHGTTITDDQVQELIRNCPNIETLDLHDTNITNQQLQFLTRYFPKLQSLNLSGCKQITDEGLNNLPETIYDLNLSGCAQLSDRALKNLPKYIRKLNLSECTQLKRPSFEELNLSELNLSGCSQLINEALQNLPINLYELDLSGCNKLTSDVLSKLLEIQKLKLGGALNESQLVAAKANAEAAKAQAEIELQKKISKIKKAKIINANEYPNQKEMNKQLKQLGHYSASKDSQILLAVNDDIIVGFLYAEEFQGNFILRNFKLRENLNKQLEKKIETDLIIKSTESAKKSGKKHFYIHTIDASDDEINYYRSIAESNNNIKLTENYRVNSDGDHIRTFYYS